MTCGSDTCALKHERCNGCDECEMDCTCAPEDPDEARSRCASFLMRDDITDLHRERFMRNYIRTHGDEALELVLEDMGEAYRVCGLIEVR